MPQGVEVQILSRAPNLEPHDRSGVFNSNSVYRISNFLQIKFILKNKDYNL